MGSIPLFFIGFNILHLFEFKLIIVILGIIRIYALLKVLKITTLNVRRYPQKTKLDYATLLLLLVLIIGSLLFFLVERGVNPEVTSYESAIWYSLVSMTTTGYGDIVPITLPWPNNWCNHYINWNGVCEFSYSHSSFFIH